MSAVRNPVPFKDPLSVIVMGASGDLARKKLFPALFALHARGLLSPRTHFFGFSRSSFTDVSFRDRLAETLTCRYTPPAGCREALSTFLNRCYYVCGSYESAESLRTLLRVVEAHETGVSAHRLFYLATTPSVFLGTIRALGEAGVGAVREARGRWCRLVIEKPFGRDRASADAIGAELARWFREDQIFRMDHYLGKPMVQNVLVLRFANRVFEPFWNRDHIEKVIIRWSEDSGIEGRGGYYDAYGIIRDVMQNHLLQLVALMAMERPTQFTPDAIQDQKAQVLSSIPPLTLADVAIGQYIAAGNGRRGYRQEPGIPTDSRTPTYAAAVLRIPHPRWEGVPFLLSAGKALDCSLSEVDIRFRLVSKNLFQSVWPHPLANRLILRIQPDPSIRLTVVTKLPALELCLCETELDLAYHSTFSVPVPDAYECLILDVMQGDPTQFIRADEVAAAWDIFTPVLHALETERIEPEPYPFGSPEGAVAQIFKRQHGFPHSPTRKPRSETNSTSVPRTVPD